MSNSASFYKKSLLAFAILFLTLLGLTLALFIISSRQDGLATSSSTHHYAWTYGPMAILVVVTGLWHQVDYQSRTLTTWHALSQEVEPVSKTLLLDYVSPISPIVCYRATKNRHWVVVASSAGEMLLNLAMIFSTALLVLMPVDRSVDEIVPMTTTFSAARINQSTMVSSGIRYWATIDRGLSLPFGTTPLMAFAAIDVQTHDLENEAIIAYVPSFVPSFECEDAIINATIGTEPFLEGGPKLQFTISVGDCEGVLDTYGPNQALNVFEDLVPSRQLLGFSSPQINCDGFDTLYWHTWSFVVLDIRYTQTFGSTRNNTLNVTSWTAQVKESTAIVCHPHYEIRNSTIEIDVLSRQILRAIVNNSSTSKQIEGYTNDNLSDSLADNWVLSPHLPSASLLPLQNTAQDVGDDMFTLVSMVESNTTLEELLDAQRLQRVAQKVLKGLAAQIAHDKLSVSINGTVNGYRRFTELRIVAKEVSVIVLCVVFGSLAIVSLLIQRFHPCDGQVRPPQSIIAHTALQKVNADVMQKLEYAGHLSDSDLHCLLLCRDCQTRNNSHNQAAEKVCQSHASQCHNNSKSGWWRPFTSKSYFLCFNGVLACGLIAALQIIHHYSSLTHGFWRLQANRSSVVRWSSLIPTAAFVFTKVALQSSGSAVLLFAPFAVLKKANSASWNAIFSGPASQLPLINLLSALRVRQVAVGLVSAASLLSSTLTIIVSGLYTVKSCEGSEQTVVSSLDYFDYNWNSTINGSWDNSAGLDFAILDFYNASYPSWVFGELAFPRVNHLAPSSSSTDNFSNRQQKVQLAIPATRASLNCTFAKPESARPSQFPTIVDSQCQCWDFSLSSQFVVPEECSRTVSPLTLNISFKDVPTISFEHPEGQYFSEETYSMFPWSSGAEYPGHCPTFAYNFGFLGPHSNSSDNITSMICYQQIEQVDTITTFVLPNWTVDLGSPPQVFEDSMRVLVPYAEYILSDIFQDGIGDFADADLDSAALDPFFHHVLYGVDGKPAQDLLGSHNQEKFMAAVQHVYRRYMAQAIHVNMRKDYRNSSAATYNATVLEEDVICLFQNKAPKLALQITLGVVLVCLVAAYVLTPMDKVLFHNPMTIAGTASLLAGGPLSKTTAQGGYLPENFECLTNAKLTQIMRWKGDTPRLGWWLADGAPISAEEGMKLLAVAPRERQVDTPVRYGIGVLPGSLNHSKSHPTKASEVTKTPANEQLLLSEEA